VTENKVQLSCIRLPVKMCYTGVLMNIPEERRQRSLNDYYSCRDGGNKGSYTDKVGIMAKARKQPSTTKTPKRSADVNCQRVIGSAFKIYHYDVLDAAYRHYRRVLTVCVNFLL